jgi:hypothetical protein
MTRAGPGGVLALFHDTPVPLPNWPGPLTTDADGTVTLRDIGPGTRLLLQARDARFANEWLVLTTPREEAARPVEVALSPPRLLEGRIVAEDTGRPLEGVTVATEGYVPGLPSGIAEARTDREGRYRLRPFPGSLTLWVRPAANQPYVALYQNLTWPANAARHRADDFALPRGVLVRGTVLEAGTGKAAAGASVRYEWSYADNPFRAALQRRPTIQWDNAEARTDADGRFALTAPAGPGTLLVKAAGPDFIHVETGSGPLLRGRPAGGMPHFPDAVLPLALEPGSPVQTPVLALRRGVTVRGRVLNHHGKPASALLVSPTYVPTGMELKPHTLPVRDGRFEVPGCEPGAKLTVWAFDPAKKEGGFAEFTVKPGAGPEVRLAPCVSARVRVVDGAGKPVARPRLAVLLLLRPGDSINDSLQNGTRPALEMWAPLAFGRDLEAVEVGTGVFTLKHLIPNASYTLLAEGRPSWPERFPFTAPPTGTREVTLTVGRAR